MIGWPPSKQTPLWLAAAALIIGTSCILSAENPRTVLLTPGQDIEAIVAQSPEGTRFIFEPGIYRGLTISPREGQQFVGQKGVILSGAMELTSWARDAEIWRSERLPRPLRFGGKCAGGGDLCKFREDLFVNGRLYRRVADLDDLAPLTWYYEDRRAYLADDPTAQSVEMSVTPRAFGGNADNVVLQNLIIEKYATNAQEGAIYNHDVRGWQITDVVARWNHGAGLTFGPQTRVKGGSFSHNGQIGILGIGEGTIIEDVEIAFNNYAGYDPSWEAGGTKFWRSKKLVVRDSCVHHNLGPGLWSDIDNVDVLYEGNRVFLNGAAGITYEISYGATIRDNVVARNGTAEIDGWLWASQILIQNSSDVEVYNNLIEVSEKFGNGIGVIYQDRGEGAYGPWHAVGNSVHDNTIVHLGSRGQNGIVTDTDEESFWRTSDNQFDRNTYIVADSEARYWTSNDRNEVWATLETLGFEEHGNMRVERRAPMELACKGSASTHPSDSAWR